MFDGSSPCRPYRGRPMNGSQTTVYRPTICILSAYHATPLCQRSRPHGQKFWESLKLLSVSTVNRRSPTVSTMCDRVQNGRRRSLAVLHHLLKWWLTQRNMVYCDSSFKVNAVDIGYTWLPCTFKSPRNIFAVMFANK